MKIVILGSLGYIGSSLCELYKNSPYKVLAIDSFFSPNKVKKLIKWGINFEQRDIFNTADLIYDAEILFNLVSITSVPQVASQATKEIDDEIWKIGTEGNRYVMKNTDSSCKFIFPSSHVVFEGLTKQVLDIDEDFKPCPLLAYGNSKFHSELDLQESNKRYIICRLGSVYGFNGSTMRYKILPNLFSLMTAQNKNLKVFGGQNQKPLIGVKDLALSLKFLAESNYHRQTYNLVSESARVIEIAQICQKFNPSIKIEETNGETPNLGYTLSNKKILSTGFKFRQNLEDEIGKMINFWSNK